MDDIKKLQTLYDADLHAKYGITLANFDEHKEGPPYLTSPRSIEACLRQGVKPRELIARCAARRVMCYMPCVCARAAVSYVSAAQLAVHALSVGYTGTCHLAATLTLALV